MKSECSGQVFEKVLNIKFLQNPSFGRRVVPCGQTDRNTTKIIVAFRNFANTPKNVSAFPTGNCVDTNTSTTRNSETRPQY